MPLYRWEKCTAGDLRYVNKEVKSTAKDLENWVRLYNEYLERFDLATNYTAYLDVCRFLIELRCAFIQSGDESLLNQIALEEINMQRLDPSAHEGATVDECLVHLSKWLGYHLQSKNITIVEFKNLMQEYGRVNQKK